MIKANELRIGNWILYTPGPDNVNFIDDNIALLEALRKFNPAFEYKKIKVEKTEEGKINGLSENQFSPILITDQILQQCGFIKDSNKRYCQNSRCLHFNPNGLSMFSDAIGIYPIQPPFNFLHEMQNLYNEIFQEELEIRDLT